MSARVRKSLHGITKTHGQTLATISGGHNGSKARLELYLSGRP